MNIITVVALIAFIAQADARELTRNRTDDVQSSRDLATNRLIDKLIDRLPNTLVNKLFDKMVGSTMTTLGKPGHLANSLGMNRRFLLPHGALPGPSLRDSALPLPGKATLGRSQLIRHLATSFSLLLLSSAAIAPANAFGTPFAIEDITYTLGPCEVGTYQPEKYGRKNKILCMNVKANARNKQAVEAASVFGFVENRNGDSVLTVNPDGTTRTGISNILTKIPANGGPVEFTLVVFADRVRDDKLPLEFRAFQAQPSPKGVEERFKPLSDCELGLGGDECE